MNTKADRPPLLARAFLRVCLDSDSYEAIAGDMHEEYVRHILPAMGRTTARRWYRRLALASALARLRRQARAPSRKSPRIPASRRHHPMQDFLLDIRFALRSFRRNPGLVAVVTATLALGIGANTSIFSVLDATLLRPLPYTDPDRLVALWESNPERGWNHNQASPANFLSWRERATAFEDATLHGWTTGWALTGTDKPEWVRGNSVFYNFFDVFKAHPILGRGFAEEENFNGARVVVISHGLWQRAFGGDLDIVGTLIRLDDIEREIVGVAPAGFSYPEPDLDVWAPLRWRRENVDAPWFRRAHFVWPVARLRDGVSVETAAAELTAIAVQLEAEYPETNTGMRASAGTLRSWVVGDTRPMLLLLGAAVAVVLLIACANIANLLLARASGRAREIAVRSALGAGRARIVRQLLTESLLLSLLGGALGLWLSSAMTRALVQLGGSAVPRSNEIVLDLRVLLFAAATTMLTGLAFGAIPALQLSFGQLQRALRDSGPALSASAGGIRTRNALIVAEVALAVLLTAGAGLMLRSLLKLNRVDPGFESANVLTVTIEIPSTRYPDATAVGAFHEQLRRRLINAPGITAVAVADTLPLEGSGWTSDFFIKGREMSNEIVIFNRRIVDRHYFETMGVPILRGRGFTASDDENATAVIVINETLANFQFAGQDPVGEQLRFGDDDDDPWFTIIGVAGAEKLEGLDSREWAEILMPMRQQQQWRVAFLVRHASGTERPDAIFRAELAAVDALVPVIRAETFEEIRAGTMISERLLAVLLGAFAALALALATIGIYGVMAYGVTQRTPEIGIRMALGAGRQRIIRMVVGHGMSLVAVGLVLGVVAYLALSRLLDSLLFAVSANDPLTLVIVVAVLASSALLASYLPARRATRIDPLETLRSD